MMRHPSARHRGTSLMDIIALVALMGLLFCIIAGIVMPSFFGGRRHRPAYRMQNGTQIRGIQQGMVLYAQNNKGYYPGFDSNGDNVLMPATVTNPTTDFTAASLSPQHPTASVYAILMTGAYFTPEYAISPLEPHKIKATPGQTPVTRANYSYALLSIADPVADKGRRAEWSDTQNSQAPVAGDRSKVLDPTMKTTSIHVKTTTSNSDDWQGNIVWNDNHVTFETRGKVAGDAIKIGTHTGKATDLDDFFDGQSAGSGLPADANALFAY